MAKKQETVTAQLAAALKPPTEVPNASGRGAIASWFAARGIPPGQVSGFTAAGKTRRQIADDVTAWLRARPKA